MPCSLCKSCAAAAAVSNNYIALRLVIVRPDNGMMTNKHSQAKSLYIQIITAENKWLFIVLLISTSTLWAASQSPASPLNAANLLELKSSRWANNR